MGLQGNIMNTMDYFFGEGTELTPLQMSVRAIVVFMVCLLLLRLSGKRAFGMRMPFDNVITILLGAILSRAVVGASPFMATLCAATAIVILYRLFAWLALYYDWFGKLIKGESKVIYENGIPDKEQMKKALITEKDMLEGVRETSNTDSLGKIKKVYLERDGSISTVKKENE